LQFACIFTGQQEDRRAAAELRATQLGMLPVDANKRVGALGGYNRIRYLACADRQSSRAGFNRLDDAGNGLQAKRRGHSAVKSRSLSNGFAAAFEIDIAEPASSGLSHVAGHFTPPPT
jgi:hypothetical protein